MPYFLILAQDCAGKLADRVAHRQEHIDYWTALPGVVKIAGAMLDDEQAIGSALLVETDDDAEAQILIDRDPFTVHGIFAATPRLIAVRPAIGEWFPKA